MGGKSGVGRGHAPAWAGPPPPNPPKGGVKLPLGGWGGAGRGQQRNQIAKTHPGSCTGVGVGCG